MKDKEYNGVKLLDQAIRKNKKLPFKELEALAVAMRNGDEKAREKLILSNLKLAVYVAIKTCHNKENIQEFISAGIEGLCYAIDHYHSEVNNAIDNYMHSYIMFYIQHYINGSLHTIKTSYYRINKDNEIDALIERYKLEGFGEDELCNMTADLWKNYSNAAKKVDSLDEVYNEDDEDSETSYYLCEECLDYDNEDNEKYKISRLKIALDRLNEVDRKIMELKYYEKKNAIIIAAELELEHKWVARRQREILKKLNRWLKTLKGQ